MGRTQSPDDVPAEGLASAGVRATYDTIAHAYDAAIGDELDGKPLDRALLGAIVELAGPGTIADVGCGPGHVTRFLATRHPDVIGIDLSPRMIEIAKQRAPDIRFEVGSMLNLPARDDAWAGAIALYSIIHLSAPDRVAACHEFARVVRTDGWLLVAFHVDSGEFASGDLDHVTNWFGESVDIVVQFLEPADVVRDLEAAGFAVMSTVIRQPWPGVEYPSRRCYLLAQHR